MNKKFLAGALASLAMAATLPAHAADKTVRIGALYPLSGALAGFQGQFVLGRGPFTF